MKYEDFENNVQRWSHARRIYLHSSKEAQTLKAVAEMGELADNITKQEDVTDDIGDIIVCLINVAFICGIDMEDCFQQAWDDIKDRRGYTIPGGTFVKEK